MKFIAFLFLAVAGFSCTQAYAWDTFRCDNDLVTVRRDSRASVVLKCGEPFLTQPLGLSSCRPYEFESIDNMVAAQAPYIVQSGPIYHGSDCRFLPYRRLDEVRHDQMGLQLRRRQQRHNPGSGQFLTILRFEGKSLQSIRFGERIE